LHLPALRQRPDDIPLLVNHFLMHQKYNRSGDGTPRVRAVSPAALECLVNYQWPGNVRELVNVVERAVSFSDANTIEPADLPDHVRDARRNVSARVPTSDAAVDIPIPLLAVDAPRPPSDLLSGDVTFKDAKERWVSSFERDYIVSLLKRHGGNISHAAREADIDRKYFRKLMKKYNIEASISDDL
jgi:DNA-binding NtrC family response regulator